MKIQELMMSKLCLPTWEEVEQACPITSSYKALEEFLIVFREWVSIIVVVVQCMLYTRVTCNNGLNIEYVNLIGTKQILHVAQTNGWLVWLSIFVLVTTIQSQRRRCGHV